MKLFLVVLLSLLSYCCTGYPTIEIKLTEDFLQGNETSIESWIDESNKTASNNSLPLDMHGFGKKVKDGLKSFKDKANNFKDKAKDVYDKYKDKAKGGLYKFKEKVKGGFDNFKDKFKDVKDKIGSKGGGSGGGGSGVGTGYYRDKYDRDYDRDRYDRDRYDRDRYNRDYNRRDRDYDGSGISDPNAKWIGLGIGIFMIVAFVGILLFYKLKGDI